MNLEEKAKEINRSIAEYIKIARIEKGLSRTKLAEELKVPVYKIAMWENPDHSFTIVDLYKINQILDIEEFVIEILSNIKNSKKGE